MTTLWKGEAVITAKLRAYTYVGGKKGTSNAEIDAPSGKHGRDTVFTWRFEKPKYVTGSDLRYFTPMKDQGGRGDDVAVPDPGRRSARWRTVRQERHPGYLGRPA
ncbi:hypothetical protein [Herbidospora mongoliensis]|uniref:hypothetical protein n=1 Tax=Herbidospora mongoliensis TaxID=688067 RepID=UPI0008337A07|nr:hypothetical protein [Herbidospora mongoliensis]